MRFHLFCFSILAPFFCLSFFKDPTFAGERFQSLDLSRRVTW
jgi:hypothetical protein